MSSADAQEQVRWERWCRVGRRPPLEVRAGPDSHPVTRSLNLQGLTLSMHAWATVAPHWLLRDGPRALTPWCHAARDGLIWLVDRLLLRMDTLSDTAALHGC